MEENLIEHDAVLQNWIIDGNQVLGNIYFDRKDRFSDGKLVRTSNIQSIDANTLYTRNTVYLLGKPGLTE